MAFLDFLPERKRIMATLMAQKQDIQSLDRLLNGESQQVINIYEAWKTNRNDPGYLPAHVEDPVDPCPAPPSNDRKDFIQITKSLGLHTLNESQPVTEKAAIVVVETTAGSTNIGGNWRNLGLSAEKAVKDGGELIKKLKSIQDQMNESTGKMLGLVEMAYKVLKQETKELKKEVDALHSQQTAHETAIHLYKENLRDKQKLVELLTTEQRKGGTEDGSEV